MKIVVIGGTGLIGSKLVVKLRDHGHGAVPASPDSGVDTLTGAGLDEVLQGAQVVVDVSNSPSFADDAVLNFFRTSTANLLSAGEKADVGHHVALSVVGTERLAGPEQFGLDELIRQGLTFRGDPREVVADPAARYFGALLEKDTLLPGQGAQLSATRFEEWLPLNPPPVK